MVDPAVLAAATDALASPSSHNSQPWLLRYGFDRGQERISARVDPRRRLDSLPAHRHEMALSLGAFWYAFAVALRARGRAITAEPSGAGASEVAARLREAPHDVQARDELSVIAARRTYRGPFLPRTVPRDAISAIVASGAASEGLVTSRCRPSVAVHEGEVVRALADLTRRSASRDFLHAAAWAETWSYLRDDNDCGAVDGFTVGQVFGSRPLVLNLALRQATRPALMPIVGRAGLARVLSHGLADLVARSAILTVSADVDDTSPLADWTRAGAHMHEVWLECTRQGLSLHPVSVLLQHEEVRRDVESVVGTPGRVVFLARLGTAARDSGPGPRLRRPPGLLFEPSPSTIGSGRKPPLRHGMA